MAFFQTSSLTSVWVLGCKGTDCFVIKLPLLVIAATTPIPWNVPLLSKVAILWSTLSPKWWNCLRMHVIKMTTPCLKRTISLHDSVNWKLNSWVLSDLDANISYSTASANNMGDITDLGIPAFMRYFPLVSSFSSEPMKELKKVEGDLESNLFYDINW